MNVGVLREIKPQENRVCMTPAGVEVLVRAGHRVRVEMAAGEGSGFADAAYRAAGAELVATAAGVYADSELVMHVKEPQPGEYEYLRPDHIVFTYLHLAASRPLTDALLRTGATCIAYETITDGEGRLPLLTPMSEVAGRMAAQEAAKYTEKTQGGRGILLGGVPGVKPATVLVIGGGVVGTHAARMAAGLGATVYLLDTRLERLRQLAETLPKNCVPLCASPALLRDLVREADAVIGAVLVRGAKAPHLITRDMLRTMKPGAVLVDVSIDQGGCFETSRPTTHAEPTYLVDGILHYCVANMPGAVPLTSTVALTNATLPYALTLANRGWRAAAQADPGIADGINLAAGRITCPGVAEAFGLPCTAVSSLL